MQLSLNQCVAVDDVLTTVIDQELPVEIQIEGVPFVLCRIFRTDYGTERLGIYRSSQEQEAFVFINDSE